MAILQISKIQIRRGQENQTGIPALDPGELAWAEDTENLYIGKSVSEGAVNNNNTRILTENDLPSVQNYASISTTTVYQYQGHITGYSVAGTFERLLQSKLDDSVSVLDFGAEGNGSTPNATYFQTGIDNLYLNPYTQSTDQSSQVIRIPAGIYNIERTVYLPPNTVLVGDGPGNTILNLTTTSAALLQFVDRTSGIGTPVRFVDGSTNMTSWVNNVVISNLTLQYDSSLDRTKTLPLLKIDCASDCLISNVRFAGTYTVYSSQAATSNYTGIDIRGQYDVYPTKELTVDNCIFENLYYGVTSNYDITDNLISNNKFRNLHRSIVFSTLTAQTNVTGPVNTKIENNKFYNIELEGIYTGNGYPGIVTNNSSLFNNFKDVGNNGKDNSAAPVASIINWGSTLGNTSVGDYFSRYSFINNTSSLYTTSVPMIASGASYVENYGAFTSPILLGVNELNKFPFSSVLQNKTPYIII